MNEGKRDNSRAKSQKFDPFRDSVGHNTLLDRMLKIVATSGLGSVVSLTGGMIYYFNTDVSLNGAVLVFKYGMVVSTVIGVIIAYWDYVEPVITPVADGVSAMLGIQVNPPPAIEDDDILRG